MSIDSLSIRSDVHHLRNDRVLEPLIDTLVAAALVKRVIDGLSVFHMSLVTESFDAHDVDFWVAVHAAQLASLLDGVMQGLTKSLLRDGIDDGGVSDEKDTLFVRIREVEDAS